MFKRGLARHRNQLIPVDFMLKVKELLEQEGIPLEELLETFDLKSIPASNSPEELEVEKFHWMMNKAAEYKGGAQFGLLLAERLSSLVQRLAHLFMSAPNLYLALKRMVQMRGEINLVLKIQVEEFESGFRLIIGHSIGKGDRPYMVSELSLGIFWILLKKYAPDMLHPVTICISHHLQGELECYKQYFGAEHLYEFDTELDCILISKEDALRENIHHDPQLFEAVSKIVQKDLENNHTHAENRLEQDWLRRSQSEMRHLLEQGTCNVEHLAEALHITPRTLQRKLKEFHLTYSELLDLCRKELVLQYLYQQKLPFKIIASKLGFNNVQSFRRAYIRWYGKSPQESVSIVPQK